MSKPKLSEEMNRALLRSTVWAPNPATINALVRRGLITTDRKRTTAGEAERARIEREHI